jgi:hypothetical protein
MLRVLNRAPFLLLVLAANTPGLRVAQVPNIQ